MMFDHLLHKCCWPTCMDNLLRCAPALRSRSSIGHHSCPCPCPCPCLFLASFVTLPIAFAALGALFASFLGSVISPATHPFISSLSTMPCSGDKFSLADVVFSFLELSPPQQTRPTITKTRPNTNTSHISSTDTGPHHSKWHEACTGIPCN